MAPRGEQEDGHSTIKPLPGNSQLPGRTHEIARIAKREDRVAFEIRLIDSLEYEVVEAGVLPSNSQRFPNRHIVH